MLSTERKNWGIMLSMDNIDFGQLLSGELEARGWSARELARRAGLSSGSISHAMMGTRQPGPDLCRGIAAALNIPEEEVFRRAGLLSPISHPEDKSLRELVEIVQRMTPEQRKIAARVLLGIATAEDLAHRSEESEEAK